MMVDLIRIKRCGTCNSNKPELLHRPCSDRAVAGLLPDDFHNTRHITALKIAKELSVKHAKVLQELAGGALADSKTLRWVHSCGDCGETPCVCVSSEPASNKCVVCGSDNPAVRLPYEWPPKGSGDWVECPSAFHLPRVSDEVLAEVARAVKKFPKWRTDPFHALAVVGEEMGEVNKALVQIVYEPEKGVTMGELRAEAIQLAAMALRFIASLDEYDYAPHEQHEQKEE